MEKIVSVTFTWSKKLKFLTVYESASYQTYVQALFQRKYGKLRLNIKLLQLIRLYLFLRLRLLVDLTDTRCSYLTLI